MARGVAGFNGGAWLRAGNRRVDVHYRDLEDVEDRITEAEQGRFGIERLLFHVAGVPTYIVAAELAMNRVLHGQLPRPDYPAALRRTAPARWRGEAQATLGYARSAHAARGIWLTPQARSPSPPARARTPCWQHADTGSPTKRLSSTRPACAQSTTSSPT